MPLDGTACSTIRPYTFRRYPRQAMNHHTKRIARGATLWTLAIALLLATTAIAGAKPKAALQTFASGFSAPVDLQVPKDGTGRFFVVEQAGTIKIIQDGNVLAQNFLDIRSKVTSGGEMGLLGLTFHPDYSSNGRFFVNYTRTVNGDQRQTVIAEYTVSANPQVADAGSETILLVVDQPFDNHKAGQLAFGPDGFLYFGLGDGGGAGDPNGNGQNLGVLLGKMLRIDVDHTDPGKQYAIPSSNPFASSGSARHEIWAFGFRNPWRFSFDPSGRLFCADVGQDRIEEIDLVRSGGNYGWNVMEGKRCFDPPKRCDKHDKILPITQYKHTVGQVVIGGYVYEGSALPALKNQYIFADFASGKIWSLQQQGSTFVKKLLMKTNHNISCFGEDGTVEIYPVAYSGVVFKLIPP